MTAGILGIAFELVTISLSRHAHFGVSVTKVGFRRAGKLEPHRSGRSVFRSKDYRVIACDIRTSIRHVLRDRNNAMTRHWKAALLFTGLLPPTFFANFTPASAQATKNREAAPIEQDTDPYAWLEDVTGEQAIEWVKTRNTKAQAAIASDPSFEKLRQDLLAILDSDARIPFVVKRGEFYYNFWRDKKNERGLWRRTTLEEFKKAEPQWEVMLDLDELGKQEGENWVWKGVRLLQ